MEQSENNNFYKEFIAWLESHNGKRPRGTINRNGSMLNFGEMTEEERYEKKLYDRWLVSMERAALIAAVGIPIDELPDYLQPYKEQISKLREYNLEKNIKSTLSKDVDRNLKILRGDIIKKQPMSDEERTILKAKREKEVYDDIIEWLDAHDGMMVRSSIVRGYERLRYEFEMSEEEKYEKKLYVRWGKSELKKSLEACVGIPIDELPSQYEKYRDRIETLRKYNLGIQEKPIEQRILAWVKEHNGTLPRELIIREDGTVVEKMPDMTQEERTEKKLSNDWKKSALKRAIYACIDVTEENIPSKYSHVKRDIIEFRKYCKISKEDIAIETMQKSAEKCGEKNEDTRHELYKIIREVEGRDDANKKD